MSNTPFYPFVPRKQRTAVTREPDAAGRWTPLFPDMIGYGQEGGGSVPADFHWRTNPKQWQEELTDAELRKEAQAHHALPEASLPLALPPGPRNAG
ncbi:MAG TPA: hypothetical protein VMH40_00625 [Myxococcaceae bacterium]|nr:hypothetical protein [Myxococcaceae bacterium]